jgi:nucleotide-binding universal stress UspA family protein
LISEGGTHKVFKKILVCLDGSDLAEKILPYAIEEAKRFEGQLVLFRVYSETAIISLALPGIPGVQMDAAGVERRMQEDQAATADYLKMMVNKLCEEKDLSVAWAAERGAAGPVIVEYCEKNAVELIMLATHGRSGPGRVVLGSVADYVIRHSSLPVFLIRPRK